MRGVVAEGAAQQEHAVGQRLVADDLLGPDGLEQLVPSHALGGASGQDQQELECPGRQGQGLAPARDRSLRGIEEEVPGRVALALGGVGHGPSAGRGGDASPSTSYGLAAVPDLGFGLWPGGSWIVAGYCRRCIRSAGPRAPWG